MCILQAELIIFSRESSSPLKEQHNLRRGRAEKTIAKQVQLHFRFGFSSSKMFSKQQTELSEAPIFVRSQKTNENSRKKYIDWGQHGEEPESLQISYHAGPKFDFN